MTAPSGLLTTRGAVTVIDPGDGARRCLGGVAESLPPQCAGVPLVGWDWRDLDGAYDEQTGVRWGVDMTRNPASGGDPMDPAVEAQLSDPRHTILNVAVTGDRAAAEASLRSLWGGMLCVTTAERTEAELTSLLKELMDAPGVLGGGADGITGTVGITVIHDDGTLQRQLDDRHGEGLIVVSSALVPA